ncbi:MAG: PASTA domain-containing protein [Lachnospiraceae bacterium]|nr:PASTA domain-containing protein [Lachnospiraceae bacterium]
MDLQITRNRKKIVIFFAFALVACIGLCIRVGYLMIFRAEYYSELARQQQERERSIKAARGMIVDVNGNVLATNKTVCTISVIHNQIEDEEAVIEMLVSELELDEETVRKKVTKVTAMEKIKSNVDKETGDRIREYDLQGVKVDEDYKRYYPYNELASKVIGFTGSDNQGIIGLEVKYDSFLKGIDGKILTLTDARGIELEEASETRIDSVPGNNLRISLDLNIQMYAQQLAEKVMQQKQANRVSIVVMNPQNGELMAMVNVPEFDLNNPYTLNYVVEGSLDTEAKQELLNRMWRNESINDTYEPGSTFKVITMAAGLEEGVVSLTDSFSCPGYRTVEDRIIRCHKIAGHGGETFLEGAKVSCNPVFIDVGQRLGIDRYYSYFEQFGLLSKTGIDLPGEAGTIMHKKENMGLVELATVSFGQSFQITPIQLLTTISSLINGGTRITPHFAVDVTDANGELIKTFEYEASKEEVVSEETSETVRYILEQVVESGSGKNAYIAGYHIGGKTATSEKLPRSLNKYISSFVGFAPADNPQVIAIVIIDEPEGVYYGGTIAAPVIKELYDNILPYLGIEPDYTETEQKNLIPTVSMPDCSGLSKTEVNKLFNEYAFEVKYIGEGEIVTDQFPLAGEEVTEDSVVILYLE